MSWTESELTLALRAALSDVPEWACGPCGGTFTVTIQEVPITEVVYYHPDRVTVKIRVDHGDSVVPFLLDLSRMGVEKTVDLLCSIAANKFHS